eukprot:TRINITY_DN6117_c0_g1_i2.p1 TRINITY_DN6117_c0_g1~~TRINITY_DN6117_c0_g1_i2.p1  ORF type:complete len:586 (-),score=242.56 TRINITY_DN6117_c0_g1_i2:368-2125(-)
MCIRDRWYQRRVHGDNRMSDQQQQPVPAEQEVKQQNVENPDEEQKEGGLSKKAQKKAEKEAKKQKEKEERQAEAAKQQQSKAEEADPCQANYGDAELIQSQELTDRVWTKVADINEELIGKEILVRARVHSSRLKGNLVFLVLREHYSTVQVVGFPGEGISKRMVKFIGDIPKESLIDIYAKVNKPEQEVLSCTQHKVELQVVRLYVVSRSLANLPFQLEDASRTMKKGEREDLEEGYDFRPPGSEESKKDEKEGPVVSLSTRLDNRIIDLRTMANQGIFRVSSGVCQLFREFLYKNSFVEIHTPKLLGGTSEGGANVFRLNYFGKDACLAQSPQLYKQMCVMADFDRVFEIGPVFRAEKSFTHRHMCEFTGLDIEMAIKEHYFEILDLLGDLFAYIFEGLETRYAAELKAISAQYPFEPFKCKRPVVKLTFEEGVKLLQEAGVDQPPLEDLSTENEKKLGRIVREKYDTDFYMLHRYPANARPFYTMLCKDDPNYTNSYDFFMRGEEITSGAQRVHEPNLLAKRAEEFGIPVATIKDYIDSFKFGAYPHGGCGIGLERVVMLYCDLGNIRKSSHFPRDPKRLAP